MARRQLDAGNVEPSHLALYCHIDSLGRPPADRHRPRCGPHIAYCIEMTRLNIPVSFRVSLLDIDSRASDEERLWGGSRKLGDRIADIKRALT
jgi:hypothetical protein